MENQQNQQNPKFSPELEQLTAWFAQTIRAWFLQNGRKLPWRNHPTPYQVWVSEIMLQQTQVVTVIPYFERWMARFPDIRALADADIDDVLQLWSGLGYYRRARYLHEGARVLVDKFVDKFPESVSELRKIPGIGAYTAGAIASFAFGQNVPAIDGNAERVFSRFFGIAGDLTSKEPRKQLEMVADLVAAQGYASDVNQAVMDIGSSCCARTSQCESCPLADQCYALRHGMTEALPQKKQRIEKYDEFRAALVLTQPNGRLLIARRDAKVLLGGLWEYPMIVVSRGKGASHLESAQMKMRLSRRKSWCDFLISAAGNAIVPDGVKSTGQLVSHTFTHIEMRVEIDCARCAETAEVPGNSAEYDAFAWVLPEEIGTQYAISTLMKKMLSKGVRNGSAVQQRSLPF